MKRWLPIVAVAFLVAGCDNSNDEPPVSPQTGSDATSSGSAANEPLATGPRGPEQTLPQTAAPTAPADSGRDSAATKPREELSKTEEQNAMPKAGQANNYMSEALTAQSGSDASGGSSSSGGGAPAAGAASGAAAPGAGGAAQPVSQEQVLALMKKHNCASCHAVDKKLVGPSYKEVAAKYKDDSSAEGKLIDKVVKGGSGVWGPVPMPPHPTVPKDDIKAIVDWILAGAN
ncbi:MAG TPA: c-type cytochrome [Zeimonas sp.]